MATLRLPLLLGTALIAAAGCAQQPPKADYAAPEAVSPATPASASAASMQLASAFSPRLLVFAYDQGWREVVVSGNDHYFCRGDAPAGSLIANHRCVTESQLEFMQYAVEQQREQLTKPIPLDHTG